MKHAEQKKDGSGMTINKGDLTRGPILSKLLHVALPIMGTQLLQMTYNLTDMYWIGRMEDSVGAVAASGLAGMFLWLGMALMLIGRISSEIGTSQNCGKGDVGEARRFAEEATRIALLLGVLYGLVLVLFTDPLVSLLQVKDLAVKKQTCDYLMITAIGIPFTYVSAAITGAFNGAGNSRLTFRANAIGLVVNMILDPLMILKFKWGVKGAAIATIIAQIIVCLLFVIFAKRHSGRPFERFVIIGSLTIQRVRQIFRWSLPVAMESGAFTALAMVVTAMVSSRYGETAVAVQRVGSQIESLSWLIGGGFSSAVAAFTGQNYGAKQWRRIRKGFRLSLGALMVWEAFVVLLLVFCGRFLFSLFLREPVEILDMGQTYLRILAICQLFTALEGACSGTFRGLGQTMPPSICSISANLIRPFLCWMLSKWMGLNGLWFGITLSAALRGTLMFIWFMIYEKKIPVKDEVKNSTIAYTV